MLRITRRSAMLAGLGFGGTMAARAVTKDFWNEKKPEDWTDDEAQQLLTKSPWAKDASIFDAAAHKGVSNAPRAGGVYRRNGTVSNGQSSVPLNGSTGNWKATVLWESALPVRDALRIKMTGFDESYIVGLVGDIPGVGVPSDDDSASERQQKLDMLKENTRIERKDDPLELQTVKIAQRTRRSPSGTLFYFSRVFPITLEDKQVTFVTKVGPLEVKCKFTLRDMMYRGNFEL
jgi:hypothetical protein